jgi:hypothetical protein
MNMLLFQDAFGRLTNHRREGRFQEQLGFAPNPEMRTPQRAERLGVR